MKWRALMFGLLLSVMPSWADWGTPVNVGPGVNTVTYEFGPNISVSGDTLYFCRTLPNDDYDIFMSVFRSGNWDSAVSVSESINTATYAEAMPFISYDGRRLYFGRHLIHQDHEYICYSERRNGVWQSPKRFEAAFNNDPYDASWPCFTHDGRRIYFCSFNRPGGRGFVDLWYSDYDTLSRTWGPPVNLGDSINTTGYEFAPALSWDDQTLYFSSDTFPLNFSKIRRARMVNGVWQKGIWLGRPPNYPNSLSDNPSLTADGQGLYFYGWDLPLPCYGEADIYVSRWEVGVEAPITAGKGPKARGFVLPNPLQIGERIELAGGGTNKPKKVTLYNLQGRLMRTWTEKELKGGSLLWDGRDGKGDVVKAGVYFLEIGSGKERVTFKAVVLH